MRRFNRATLGLSLLFVALFQTSCSSTPKIREEPFTITEVQIVEVPKQLTEHRSIVWPDARCFDGPSIVFCNKDLATLVKRLAKALEQSNADKQAIRALESSDAIPTDNTPPR